MKILKITIIFNNVAQNIDCEYMFEKPRRGGFNEYPQSMFWIKIGIPLHTPVLLYLLKLVLNVVYITRTRFPDRLSYDQMPIFVICFTSFPRYFIKALALTLFSFFAQNVWVKQLWKICTVLSFYATEFYYIEKHYVNLNLGRGATCNSLLRNRIWPKLNMS